VFVEAREEGGEKEGAVATMEALERLQAVHAHVRLLHTHHIATAHAASNRFLARFLLLLVSAPSYSSFSMPFLT
jgi:hypothetical protein